ncbi:unnamed protein product [Protopolystoma xenopodis]|uniref:Uncharacterized protein n=1 Tax=Protopolystoma xenopodis TaxID=117903 RepID=A0A3S4ZY26_9PLAT|nr:unnamed protein product [Protopolystoma xenopodis]
MQSSPNTDTQNLETGQLFQKVSEELVNWPQDCAVILNKDGLSLNNLLGINECLNICIPSEPLELLGVIRSYEEKLAFEDPCARFYLFRVMELRRDCHPWF